MIELIEPIKEIKGFGHFIKNKIIIYDIKTIFHKSVNNVYLFVYFKYLIKYLM